MLPVDIEQFWKDDILAHEYNCFSPRRPQAAFGIWLMDDVVFGELDAPGADQETLPYHVRLDLNRRYNDKAEAIIGRRLMYEDIPAPDATFPAVRQIGQVFGGRYVRNGHSLWLERCCDTPKELEQVLDRVERIDLRRFILPPNWDSEKRRIYETYGRRPAQWRMVRGPITLASSLYGGENMVYLIVDEPDLARRFSRVISDVIFDIATIMDEEAGYAPGEASPGFKFNDDDCYLMTPEMYELFGLPVLKRIFEHFSPDPGDPRFQHSDSDMGHLVPVLARLDLTGCNFGPKVSFDHIRRHMPRTRVDGVLDPMAMMRNDEVEIIAQVKRDCAQARATRGLNVCTAGVVNNGTKLDEHSRRHARHSEVWKILNSLRQTRRWAGRRRCPSPTQSPLFARLPAGTIAGKHFPDNRFRQPTRRLLQRRNSIRQRNPATVRRQVKYAHNTNNMQPHSLRNRRTAALVDEQKIRRKLCRQGYRLRLTRTKSQALWHLARPTDTYPRRQGFHPPPHRLRRPRVAQLCKYRRRYDYPFK